MASTQNLRLASVTARDGFDTRNKELNVACNEKQELAYDEMDEEVAVIGRKADLKAWVNFMPELRAPLTEWMDLIRRDAREIAPVWRNWVNASKTVTDVQSYSLRTAGFSMELAEASTWDALMSSINALELDEADYELVMGICEYNRELTRFRQTVENELVAAAEGNYAPHVVESVRGMIEIARDSVHRARQKIILCEGRECLEMPTNIFYHLDEGKVYLCEGCWNFACHHQTYHDEKPTPYDIHRMLDALNEERGEMVDRGLKDTEEYALLDRTAQSLVDMLKNQ